MRENLTGRKPNEVINEIETDLKKNQTNTQNLPTGLSESLERMKNLRKSGKLNEYSEIKMSNEKENMKDKPDFEFIKHNNSKREMFYDGIKYSIGQKNTELDLDLFKLSENHLGLVKDGKIKYVFSKIHRKNIQTYSRYVSAEEINLINLEKTNSDTLLKENKISPHLAKTIQEFEKNGPEIAKNKILNNIYKILRNDPSPILKDEIANFIKSDHPISELKNFEYKLPDFTQIRKESLKKLTDSKLIETKQLNNKEIIIIDLEKLKKAKIHDLIANKSVNIYLYPEEAHKKSIYHSKYYGNKNELQTLNYIFNEGVISKEDYENSIKENKTLETKNLYYMPKSIESALDPAKIKKSNFYLGFWENKSWNYHEILPELNNKEVAFACIVFHPKFCNGRINSSDNLEIFNKKTGVFQKLSMQYIIKTLHISLGGTSGENINLNNGRSFAKKYLAHLLEKGLIKLEDFATTQPLSYKEHGYPKRKISNGGYVMFNKIRYYIPGFRKNQKDIESTLLSDDLGCVYNIKTGNILYTFKTQNYKDLIARQDVTKHEIQNQKLTVITLDKNQTDTHKYSDESFNKKQHNETETEYNNRINLVENFKFELKFSKMLSELSNSISFENLSTKFKKIIIANKDNLINNLGDIKNFTDKFGKEGLESIVTIQLLNKGDNKFTKILENMDSEDNKKEFLHAIATEFSPTVQSLQTDIVSEILDSENINFNKTEYGKLISTKLNTFLDYFLTESKLNPNTNLSDIDTKIRFQKLPFDFMEVRNSLLEKSSLFLANTFGAEKTVELLNNLFQETKNEDTKEIIDNLIKFINPETPKELMHELKELYRKINFEEYKLNEKSQKTDKLILEDTFGKPKEAGKILDSGCGTGRMLISLHDTGYNIEGIDLAENHVKIIKGLDPEIKVNKTDWKNLAGHTNNSVDNIYSIGRNILHEYHLNDQQKMFQEANRILKIGGKYIFDIPDSEKGHYKELIDSYTNTMHRRDIRNFRHNTIYDSPDGEHFFTRYVYSHEDIVNLATENGFKIVNIREVPLETGKDDVDKYYVLEKVADINK